MVLLIVYSKCTLDMVLSNEPEHILLSFPKMDEKTTKKSKKPIKIYIQHGGYRRPICLIFFRLVKEGQVFSPRVFLFANFYF